MHPSTRIITCTTAFTTFSWGGILRRNELGQTFHDHHHLQELLCKRESSCRMQESDQGILQGNSWSLLWHCSIHEDAELLSRGRKEKLRGVARSQMEYLEQLVGVKKLWIRQLKSWWTKLVYSLGWISLIPSYFTSFDAGGKFGTSSASIAMNPWCKLISAKTHHCYVRTPISWHS